MATIEAKRIVEALRGVYDIAPPFDFNAGKRDIQAARELQALALGHLIPGLSDEQILAVATGRATLRGQLSEDKGQVSGALTFHDVPCLTCHGAGSFDESGGMAPRVPCPTCGGDRFSPPISA